MALKNNTLKYGSVAKTFHWLIAVMIIGMIAVGFIMSGMEPSLDKLKLVGLHKSFGITVLALAVLRFAWKLHNTQPLLPYAMKPVERLAAKGGHALLYFFMAAMPLSGWAMSSAAGYTVSVFGWFNLPNLVQPDNGLRLFFSEAHGLMAWGLIAMITLHALAALYHHFIRKDNILLRMLPYGTLRKEGYSKSDTMAGC